MAACVAEVACEAAAECAAASLADDQDRRPVQAAYAPVPFAASLADGGAARAWACYAAPLETGLEQPLAGFADFGSSLWSSGCRPRGLNSALFE